MKPGGWNRLLGCETRTCCLNPTKKKTQTCEFVWHIQIERREEKRNETAHFALTGTLNKTSNVDELNGSRDCFLRIAEFGEHLKTRIRNSNNTNIRLNRTKGEVSSLSLSILDLELKKETYRCLTKCLREGKPRKTRKSIYVTYDGVKES